MVASAAPTIAYFKKGHFLKSEMLCGGLSLNFKKGCFFKTPIFSLLTHLIAHNVYYVKYRIKSFLGG